MPKPANIIDATRISDIAAKIRGACLGINEPDEAKKALQDQLNEAASESRNARERIMLTVAQMSHDDRWTAGEITAACKHAVETGNKMQSDKALATFISEVKNVAHPDVREVFPDLVDLRDAAWNAETQELAMADTGDKPPAPLRKAFSRAYHMLGAMVRAVKEGEAAFDTTEAVVAFAEARNPDHDPDRVAKRIEGIVKTLNAMFADFPHDDLKSCSEYLTLLKPEDLIAARKTLMVTTSQAGVLVSSTPVVTAPSTTVVATPSHNSVDPAAGAIDALDEILGDLTGDEQRLAA